MKKSIGIILLAICFVACTDDKTYYDANWKETTKEKASFYRTLPIKENGVWQIRDYYISGEKQFIGQAKDSLATVFEGEITWYFKTGKVQNKVRYKNGEMVASFATVEGARGSEEEGWNEGDLYFYEDLAPAANAQSSREATPSNVADAAPSQRTDINEYFFANTSTVASEHTRNIGYEDKNSFSYFFNELGDTIGRLDYNGESEKWEGKEVVFYETERKGEMKSIKEIKIYNKGLVEQAQYFDENEKEIASGSFKKGEPFTGTFFKEACWFKKIQHYQKGNLRKEITFDFSDKKIGEISFKNKKPNTGVLCNCASLETYKNGKLDGPSVKYLNDGVGEDLKEEYKYGYKNGLKHGDYFIRDMIGYLLEKGTYENGVQTGEVWYYNDGEYIEEEDRENAYYLKTKIQIVNSKPFISELSQFSLEDNELLETFELEPNTTDKYTFLKNGFHLIYLKDFNSDGFDDLQIWCADHLQDFTSNTFYLYNSKTKKYEHLADLDNADNIEMNTGEKTIKAIIGGRFDYQTNYITYDFLENKLLKRLEIEEVHHQEKDTTFLTQIFPIPVNDFPMLDNSLPPITFVQEGKQQQITDTHQTLNLKKAPFSIVLPGLIHTRFPNDFDVKITASYNKEVFKKATVDQREEDTSILDNYSTFASGSNNPFFIIDGDGHNILYYDNTRHATLEYLENINEKVLLLQFDINKMHDGDKEKVISEIDKPIYMMIYMDKNENTKIDNQEIFYVTLNF